MAINTDTTYGKSALGEREVSHQGDFHDTEKLLSSTMASEPAGGASNMNPSDTTFTLSTMRGSVHSLDAEQMGHVRELKSGSVGHLATTPRSCSRLSLGPPLSPVPPGTKPPPSYLWLAVMSCFLILSVPISVCALWYAHASRSILANGDVETARKFGRRAMLLSYSAIAFGVACIIFIVLTIEMQ